MRHKYWLYLDPERCLLAERDLVRSPAHFILRSCMLEDFSLSDKSELFPLNPVSGSSTFSSSTSYINIVLKCVHMLNVGIKDEDCQRFCKIIFRWSGGLGNRRECVTWDHVRSETSDHVRHTFRGKKPALASAQLKDETRGICCSIN